LLIALLVAALSPAMRALTYYFVVSPTEYLPFFLTFRSPFTHASSRSWRASPSPSRRKRAS
jgi:hypothetical protein